MGPMIGITVSADPGPAGNLVAHHKLYYLPQQYARAIEKSGAIPVMLPILKTPHVIEAMLQNLDGLVLTGGIRPLPTYMIERLGRGETISLSEQDPGRNHWDTYLVGQALGRDMPVLAICRGAQVLASVLGCSIESCHFSRSPELLNHHQTLPADQPSHFIQIASDSKLGQITRESAAAVNSFHSQAVSAAGTGVGICAWAEDGVVEAFESLGHTFVLGVQFHPERLTDRAPWRRLFFAFRGAAEEYGRSFRYRIRYQVDAPPQKSKIDG